MVDRAPWTGGAPTSSTSGAFAASPRSRTFAHDVRRQTSPRIARPSRHQGTTGAGSATRAPCGQCPAHRYFGPALPLVPREARVRRGSQGRPSGDPRLLGIRRPETVHRRPARPADDRVPMAIPSGSRVVQWIGAGSFDGAARLRRRRVGPSRCGRQPPPEPCGLCCRRPNRAPTHPGCRGPLARSHGYPVPSGARRPDRAGAPRGTGVRIRGDPAAAPARDRAGRLSLVGRGRAPRGIGPPP